MPLAAWLFLAAMVIGVAGLLVSRDLLFLAKPNEIRVSSGSALGAAFNEMDYRLADVASGSIETPHLLIERFPKGWHTGLSVPEKKRVFYRALLPLVLRVNQEIAAERDKVQQVLKSRLKGQGVSADRAREVRAIAKRYRQPLDPGPLKSKGLSNLLRRVDQIPVSIALGQGAYESGYGTSRFATKGNALYGQWAWGKGMAPAQQRSGKGDYRVATFGKPLDSVRSYALNLNTHKAYRSFRELRAELRRLDKEDSLNGKVLAKTLNRYSERGEAYVASLTKMISKNDLWPLDSAVLEKADPRRVRIMVGK